MTDNMTKYDSCVLGDDCGNLATAREVEGLREEVARLKSQLAAIGPHMKVDPAAIYPQSGGIALEGKGG